MASILSEWLHLFVRWAHILTGIMWIGTSIFFNWMDSHLEAPATPRPGVEGELWMVHSGGFYVVEKKHVAPAALPRVLHWFKWEAGFTWLTGATLLGLVYYAGGGALLVDAHVSSIGVWPAIFLCVGLLIASWFIYDTLWISPLRHHPRVATLLMIAMIAGVAYGLSHVISGRAAYMHTGAMMGTWMAWNVWVRILPAQKALVAATQAGTRPDPELGKKAKQRSRHNNYMTYPVVFVMLSNHFPSTYGSTFNWVILLGLFALAVGVRHFENTGDRSPAWLIGALVAVLLIANSALVEPDRDSAVADAGDDDASTAPSVGGPAGGDAPPNSGSIEGVVTFAGKPPPRRVLAIPSGCAPEKKGATLSNDVLVRDGKLQNAFVWIKRGMEGWKGEAPAEEVVLDQHGCLYEPRITGAQVGQRVTFVTSDPVLHNVRLVAHDNPTFNANMPIAGMRISKTFMNPEVMMNAKCDIHPWMSGWFGVVPHPYFAVSNAKGAVTLKNVPPGEYVVEAWHEVYGRQERTIRVLPKQTAKIEFVFKP